MVFNEALEFGELSSQSVAIPMPDIHEWTSLCWDFIACANSSIGIATPKREVDSALMQSAFSSRVRGAEHREAHARTKLFILISFGIGAVSVVFWAAYEASEEVGMEAEVNGVGAKGV